MNSERNITEELTNAEATGDSVQSENSDQLNHNEAGSDKKNSPDSDDSEKLNSEAATSELNSPEEEVSLNNHEDFVGQEDQENHDDRKDHEDHDDHESESLNLSKLSKSEILKLLEDLESDDHILGADKKVNALKSRLDEILDQERSEALEKFIEEGGEESAFEFIHDEITIKFEATYRLLKDRKRKYLNELEKAKDQNHEKALETLEKLRQFVDSDESSSSFNRFKSLQVEWKEIGPLPKNQVKNLWANYNALVNLFYDKRSIYFELKELDRKKNLEAKLELCERAEALVGEENLRKAIVELNDLHNEFKHIGPVPLDEQENLWKRFKTASDEIYARRKEFYQQFKATQKENLEKKEMLIEKIKPISEFSSDRIKDWNQKTKAILALQKEWEAVGSVPKEHSRETNKHFWSYFKEFFRQKNKFFKDLESKRDENLKIKEDLVSRAKDLVSNEDLEKTAEEIKDLQKKWKEVGPVPEKKRQEIFDKFKAVCDEFFDKRRMSQKETVKQYEENLEKKKEIIEEIRKLAEEKSSDLSRLNSLKQTFSEIGFVPRNAINSTRSAYAKAVETFIKNANIEEGRKEEILIEAEFSQLRNDPNSDKKFHQKEQSLRRQIHQVENDINLMKTNMEYFAESKKAQILKDQFNEKISDASDELSRLKRQLKILRSAR